MSNIVLSCSVMSAKARCVLMLLFSFAALTAGAAQPRLSAADTTFSAAIDSTDVPVRIKALPQKALDVKAEFPGGTEKMHKFIRQWLKSYGFGNYTGEMDTVRVGFIVEADGTITGARILRHGTYVRLARSRQRYARLASGPERRPCRAFALRNALAGAVVHEARQADASNVPRGCRGLCRLSDRRAEVVARRRLHGPSDKSEG